MRERRFDRVIVAITIAVFALAGWVNRAESADEDLPKGGNPAYAAWANGPGTSDEFFPIAVWLQSPRRAPEYKAIGIPMHGETQSTRWEVLEHTTDDVEGGCLRVECGL
jgi:hypothetical protein